MVEQVVWTFLKTSGAPTRDAGMKENQRTAQLLLMAACAQVSAALRSLKIVLHLFRDKHKK